jgi:predicted GH43/DUF377 family glycosyl hydrolase
MIELERLSDQPVVVPDPARPWERAATFNTAAIYDNGLFPLFYRATDIGCHARFGDYMNSIGYADNTYRLGAALLDTVIGVAALRMSDARF